MCRILVDVEIETGSYDAGAGSDVDHTVICAEGRVIVAACAYQVWPSPQTPSVVKLSDGELTDEVVIRSVGNPGSITNKTVNYFLTTARVAEL